MAVNGGAPNSRNSVRAAGWACAKPGRYEAYVPNRRPLSWLDPSTLWQSRNDTVARKLGDPTDDFRRAWMRAAGNDLTIDHRGRSDVAFMVVGDPGEGDASQWATIPPLEATWGGTDFMVIMSDVIYPAGSVNDYEAKFYRPYRDYPQPIYAIPGNHDWYDDLHGFMFHLCRVDQRGELHPTWTEGVARWKLALHRRLWRHTDRPDPGMASVRDTWRPLPSQRSSQRTPYWTIELDSVRLVGIDTGIVGRIDRDQGEWLRAVSLDPGARDKPKVLITGKPLHVDGKYHPCPIEGGGTVDEIVRMPEAGYIAAIGGDIHNYQRYPVRLPDGRTLQYIVAGGGGAFMHPTHTIPRVRLPGCDERDFICYPRRGDSLSIFSKLYDKRLGFRRGFIEISPDEASAYMAERLGVESARDTSNVVVGKRVRWAAERILPLPGRWQGPLHPLMALWFDLNTPPMFKSFLRIDASADRFLIRCYAATGCREQEDDPPLEDAVVCERGADGAWSWERGARRTAAVAS
jgi:hypothetical protein